MNIKQLDKLISVLIGISSILIIVGAFLKISHYQHGAFIIWIGFMSNFVLSAFEINRLKKIIKVLEKEEIEKK